MEQQKDNDVAITMVNLFLARCHAAMSVEKLRMFEVFRLTWVENPKRGNWKMFKIKFFAEISIKRELYTHTTIARPNVIRKGACFEYDNWINAM